MDETAARIRDEANRRQREMADIAERLTIRINNAIAVRESQDPVSRQLTNHSIREMLLEYERACSEYEREIPTVISPEIIEESVSIKSGIPLSRLTENEAERLLKIEEIMGQRVIGQPAAKQAVAAAVRRSRQGLRDFERPAGVFMFLGPTGVGKTELARELARFLFYSEENLVRIDMSEYQQEHDVKRLTGAPPSYVGYGDPGRFEAVRRKRYTVVLLDEIEKAHPKVFDLFLQILDHGKCTDSQGREIDFTNSYIIFTSNLGAGRPPQEVRDVLESSFRPEFLGRIGENNQIVFESLTASDLRAMVGIHTRELIRQVYEKGFHLEIADGAKDVIAEAGYQPKYGARPLKQAISTMIECVLSDLILANQFSAGDTIRVEAREGKLMFVKGEPGKFEPPRVTLTAQTDAIWDKLCERIDEGGDFELEELYPLMPKLPRSERIEAELEISEVEETPAPAPVAVEVKPEPVLPPPVPAAEIKVEPPPPKIEPVTLQANEAEIAEVVRSFLNKNGKTEIPPAPSISNGELRSELSAGISDDEYDIICGGLFDHPGASSSPPDCQLRPDKKLTPDNLNDCMFSLDMGSRRFIRFLRPIIMSHIQEKGKIQAFINSISDNLDVIGAVGTLEDIPLLEDLSKKYQENKEYGFRTNAHLSIIRIAKRYSERNILLKYAGYRAAQQALAELARPEHLHVIPKMLRNSANGIRMAALLMLSRVGSRENLPAVIMKLKNDTDEKVKGAAAEAFGTLATREELPIIREMAESEDKFQLWAAGLAFARIAERDDLEEIKELCGNYTTGENFRDALLKISTREDFDFQKELGEYVVSPYSFPSGIKGMYMEAFPDFATTEDMELIKKLLESKRAECKIIGFRAYCQLLTQFEINQLYSYIKDYNYTPGQYGEIPRDVKASIEIARLAEQAFGRLAGEENLSTIVKMLNRGQRSQVRAAFLALSKPDIFTQIPSEMKKLLEIEGRMNEEKTTPNLVLIRNILAILSREDEILL
jgi:energy-coupling factor transporter ATP-binding protein EcfA2